MPAYAYCAEDGDCFEEIFLSYKDAPKEYERNGKHYVRQFPNPAVFFKGPFSGATKNILHKDDGRVYEKGTRNDQKNKKKYKEEERDKKRRDFLAKEVQNYDL